MNDRNAIPLLAAAPAVAMLPSGTPSGPGEEPAQQGPTGPSGAGESHENADQGGKILEAGLGWWNGPGRE